ncbi:MAG TPA: hypothetical protein VGE29_01215 [Prosthecobacter sp.]
MTRRCFDFAMIRFLLHCIVFLVLSAFSYGQYSEAIHRWPQVHLKLSQEVTVSDLFSSGMRPYRRPNAENRNLYAKHAHIIVVDRDGKAYPEIPADILRTEVRKPWLIASMEIWTPPLTINEARAQMLKWLPITGRTEAELDEFLRAVEADWLHYDVVNGLTDVVRFADGWRDKDGSKKNLVLMKSWQWQAPLRLCFELHTMGMRSRRQSEHYDGPIPPPVGFEGADMKAPKDWDADERFIPVTTESRPVQGTLPPVYPAMNDKHREKAPAPKSLSSTSETHAAWVKERSAGLVTDQKIDPESNEPRGTVTAGNLTIDLGETPPVYRHQLQTLECPVMLGDKHQRRSYEIYVTSFLIEVDGIAKKYPLHVTYPRWVDNGIQTSGGFVFVKNENPVTKIGVILPKVKIPGDMGPGAKELLEWQILVRVNDRSYVDTKTSAKEQTLGSDTVVLMPTHPEKIPASSSVVWFKFEKDGTVSLLDD